LHLPVRMLLSIRRIGLNLRYGDGLHEYGPIPLLRRIARCYAPILRNQAPE
jgi:hypothetical protein